MYFRSNDFSKIAMKSTKMVKILFAIDDYYQLFEQNVMLTH